MSLDKFGRRKSSKLVEPLFKLAHLENRLKIADINKVTLDKLNDTINIIDGKTRDLQTFTSRDPPTASNHMVTKKYVDDAIKQINDGLSVEIQKIKAMFKIGNADIRSDLLNVMQQVSTHHKDLESINNKIVKLYERY